MTKVKDKLWIWGHEAGAHNDQYGLPGHSRTTPAEGADYLGVSNVIFVRYSYQKALDLAQEMAALASKKQVVWSIVGAGGGVEGDETAAALRLAARYPNVGGVQLDDFFGAREDGKRFAVYSPDELRAIKERLTAGGRRLDIWVTFYTYQMDLPVDDHLNACDTVECWTWNAPEISNLERNFERLERKAPLARKALGCYMWNYGDSQPMPLNLMAKQCELGLSWLKAGRIDALIFLASCICDLRIEAVEWAKRWVAEVGEEEL